MKYSSHYFSFWITQNPSKRKKNMGFKCLTWLWVLLCYLDGNHGLVRSSSLRKTGLNTWEQHLWIYRIIVLESWLLKTSSFLRVYTTKVEPHSSCYVSQLNRSHLKCMYSFYLFSCCRELEWNSVHTVIWKQ